ncbi:MAG TPA: OmpH family outer membrane protein, partial [Candidatus Dormibacteraeota bacterium]|nr:OmpH family outer membrane protein [Candidatus Dormibacteraeota bacterium]
QNDREDVMRRIGQQMIKVSDQYAPKAGYSLVIDSGQVPVYYVGKGIDITPEVVKAYDAANPVQASATSGESGADQSSAAQTSSKPAAKPKP